MKTKLIHMSGIVPEIVTDFPYVPENGVATFHVYDKSVYIHKVIENVTADEGLVTTVHYDFMDQMANASNVIPFAASARSH